MSDKSNFYFRALTIAGSDSGGGAGIQADLKTFSALGCYGYSVITALTAQNTKQVKSIFDISSKFVADQLDAVLSDIGVDAVKIGMLHTPEIIFTVADRLRYYSVKTVVLDPVMVAKSGDLLLQNEAIASLKTHLLPLAKIITPNLPEASVLLGREVRTPFEMEKAAKDLLGFGSQVVLLKGGHLDSSFSSDYICSAEDEFKSEWLKAKRIETLNTHGTGCTLSSAITAFLARGLPPLAAIKEAKTYLSGAIEAGASYSLGKGHGPVHHFYRLWKSYEQESEL